MDGLIHLRPTRGDPAETIPDELLPNGCTKLVQMSTIEGRCPERREHTSRSDQHVSYLGQHFSDISLALVTWQINQHRPYKERWIGQLCVLVCETITKHEHTSETEGLSRASYSQSPCHKCSAMMNSLCSYGRTLGRLTLFEHAATIHEQHTTTVLEARCRARGLRHMYMWVLLTLRYRTRGSRKLPGICS
jgi:hypothetical protein